MDLKYNPEAVSAIEKVSKYLATNWFKADEPVKDKWVGFETAQWVHKDSLTSSERI